MNKNKHIEITQDKEVDQKTASTELIDCRKLREMEQTLDPEAYEYAYNFCTIHNLHEENTTHIKPTQANKQLSEKIEDK